MNMEIIKMYNQNDLILYFNNHKIKYDIQETFDNVKIYHYLLNDQIYSPKYLIRINNMRFLVNVISLYQTILTFEINEISNKIIGTIKYANIREIKLNVVKNGKI